VISYLKSLVILAIIAGAVVPSGAFGSSKNSESALPQATIATAENNLLPVIANPAPDLRVAVNQNIQYSCDGGAFTVSNLVQDTGLINFNQAANCFTIRAASFAFQPRLDVTRAESTAVVVVKHDVFSLNNFIPALPTPASTTSLPVFSMIVVLSFIVIIRPIRRAARAVAINIVEPLTISQLQVMRC
jgi:hypothetical protein